MTFARIFLIVNIGGFVHYLTNIFPHIICKRGLNTC